VKCYIDNSVCLRSCIINANSGVTGVALRHIGSGTALHQLSMLSCGPDPLGIDGDAGRSKW
jgi:hypothetical protein